MRKILVIEADPIIRRNILDLLQAEEFDTIGAENGLTGVQLAQAYLPNPIISERR